ncbi:glycosyltransferase family 2 protein [Klenkia taihuensis]|uniref:Glycosyltransferase, GT2 family n=1 Tax=Klenkia taihuensis TaxID=1225127 RepID=A0A1I1QI26_9ACTN|nr:glycosyltransferase family 2 protein [Klenkia taihuensis]GHE07793.1 glycosyl transferase [Klenkia taihuensis]SFD21804.1 Glycosyltransferase, GT2 family [Klenkia taihuensis]
MTGLADRLTVVLLTHDCAAWLPHTLDRLAELDLPVVAVDNASTDGTRELLADRPWVRVRALPTNTGAAGRTEGVRAATTPYVVFCDDDGWWERPGLERAVALLDAHPRLALVNARIVVGDEQAPDPISTEMAASPLPETEGVPGTVLLSFMGGAAVVRVAAYEQVGGYAPEFTIGGEEETLAHPLLREGWLMRYVDDVVMHHHPSLANHSRIRHWGLRNTLWNAWLHRPRRSALRWTVFVLRSAPRDADLVRGVLLALRGVPWVLARRRPLPDDVDAGLRVLEERRFAAWDVARLAGLPAGSAPKYPVTR